MTLVITRACETCLDAACVDVCPMDCIHGPAALDSIRGQPRPGLQLFINPEECIDCGACEPECPVSAIAHDDQLASGADDLERAIRFFEERAET